MSLVKVVVNPEAVRSLMRSDWAERIVRAPADRIAAAAGEGNEASSGKGRVRARARVTTTTFEAILSESQDHTLSQALDAGR